MNFASLNSNTIPNQEELQSYIRTFSSTCANPACGLSHLLRFWSTNKSWLRPYFPNLIYSTPVDYQPNLERPMRELVRKWRPQLDDMRNLISYPTWRIYNESPEDYQRLAEEHQLWGQLFRNDTLLENRVPFTHTFPNGIKVQKGQKLMRVLKQIAEMTSFSDFEFFRQDHSRVLQTRHLRADLCLSIHPLDYLTMSDANTWSSCMNWMCEGEYRMGTVEMMNSPYMVVAYLRSPDNEISWSGYYWNDKIWRCLLIADPKTKAITSVKPYPYYNADLIQMAEKQLASILQWQGEPYKIEKNSYTFDTEAMYNDFWSTTHWMLGSVPSNYHINYSGPAECMICGKELDCVKEGQELYTSCTAEEDPCYCACCDDRIPRNEIIYDYWGSTICQDCLESKYVWDDFAEGYFDVDDCYTFTINDTTFVASPNTHYWTRLVSISEPRYNEVDGTYYLFPEDLTPEGRKVLKGAF